MTFIALVPSIYFNAAQYGTKSDFKTVSDGAITTGTPTLTSTTAAFTSSDVGKFASVVGAGAAGVVLNTTISAYVSSTQVTLAANASTTVSGASIQWGTDDATALQNAINASSAGSTVFFPGNHAIGSTIQLLAGRNYVGPTQMTSNQPTFIQINSSNLPAIVASYEWYNNNAYAAAALSVSNIVVDGNSAHNTTSHGIVIQGYDSIIDKCYVQNVAAAGIVLTAVTRNGTNSANGAGEMYILNCKVNNAGTYGIWGHDNNGGLSDCYLADCIVATTGDVGINIESAGGWVIRGNHLYSGQTSGIACGKCFATSITDNYIDGFGFSSTPAYYYGIYASMNGPRPTIISGNRIATLEGPDTTHYNYISVVGNSSTETEAIVFGNHISGGSINTTSTTSLVSGAATPCTPVSMDNIVVGRALYVDGEIITVASTTSTTFTPTTNWVSNHGTGSYHIFANKTGAYSIALDYEATANQKTGGYPETIVSFGNRVLNCSTYSFIDSYINAGPMGVEGGIAGSQSASAQSLSNGSTITTRGLDSNVVTSSSNVTGAILQKGTQAGQRITVINSNQYTIQLDVYSTSFSALSFYTIGPYNSVTFTWDAVDGFWSPFNQALITTSSASVTASNGTITTTNIDVVRIAPTAAITGVILQAGYYSSQSVRIVNESAFTVTMAASGTSNVADGVAHIILPNSSVVYLWDTGTSLWYSKSTAPIQSATAVATASSGTIATAGLDISRVNPAAAVTGIILAAGTYAGQFCKVVNESAFSLTMAVSGTSNVADGVANIILPKEARLYVWDSSTSLWYSKSTAPIQSATAVATAGSGTIATAGLDISRIAPTAAVTGIILAAGTYAGQLVVVVNEATTTTFSVTFAASGTSNVANGVAEIIPGQVSRCYVWDSSTSLWYSSTSVPMQSATAVSTATGGTIATAGLDISRVTTSGAVTGVILSSGTYAGQRVTVVNESANTITFAASGTSHVADGSTAALNANAARQFVWDSGTSLWYRCV